MSLHSTLCLFVCGSYCRHRVSSAAMIEGQNMLSNLAVSTGWHKLKKSPSFAVELDCMV